jgi:hypothetical protein
MQDPAFVFILAFGDSSWQMFGDSLLTTEKTEAIAYALESAGFGADGDLESFADPKGRT